MKSFARSLYSSDLPYPATSFGVLQRQQFLVRPMKVIRKEGYLLINLGERVAYDSPDGSGPTSNFCSQCGQTTLMEFVPLPLIRL